MSDLEDKGGPPAGAADEDLANSDTLAAAEQQRPVPTEVGGFAQLAGDPEGSGGQTPTTGPHRRVTGRQPLAGRTIADGRYTFVERLGKGGMSEVYSARHELLHKTVAIKVLREELAGSRQALERFQREARAAAQLKEPHIVDVTDYGYTEDGDAFIVMEQLDGCDLRQTLQREGALPFARAVSIARQTLRALRSAHEQGIIHRDLKAENVFLIRRDGRDYVKLLDFGISKLRTIEGSTALTSTGQVMGTPQYIAPEQAYGEADVDHRADIYAMGVILYEMLTGELPFVADSALALMMKHVQEEPQPPRQRRPDLDIPPDLEALVLKALSKDREDRPASAEAMLAALPGEAASGGYPSVTTGVAARPAARWALPAVGGVLLLVAVGASLWAVFDSEPRQGGGEPIATADQGAAPAATSGRAAGATEARAGAPRDGGRRADAASGPRLTRLTLKVSPARATVFVDGKRLEGRTVSRAPGTVIAVRATARRCGALRREITFKRRDFQETIVIRCRRHGAGSGSRHKDKIGDTAPNPFAR